MDPMSGETGAAVAARYGLGVPTGAPSYADRGELGRIWRLETDRGVWAVKEAQEPVPESGAAADVAFQLAAAAAGIPLPRPVLTTGGRVLLPGREAGSPAATLRVYEWVDLVADELVGAAELGGMTARLHRIEHPATGPVAAWFAEPIGADAWRDLLSAARKAWWAEPLAGWLPDLIALDDLVAPPDADRIRTCHLDVNQENLRPGRDGGIVVLDWENSGPAQPERELAAIIADLAVDVSVEAAVAAYDGYLRNNGRARITGLADFSTAISVQGRLLRFYGGRTLDQSQPEENRQRADRRLRSMLGRPLTRSYLDDLLAAVHA